MVLRDSRFVAATVSVVALCAVTACGVEGSGAVAADARTLSPFTRVRVAGALNASVNIHGSAHSVSVSGDDNIVPLISSEVNGDELVIDSTKPYSTSLPLKIEISAPSLQAAALSGAGTFYVYNVSGESMRLDLSGAGKLVAAGKTGKLVIDLSGAGSIDAESVEAASVTATVSGAGTALVYATGTLEATVSGAGKVRYGGDPEVTENVSGVGKVEKM